MVEQTAGIHPAGTARGARRIRVLVVEPLPLIRGALEALLEREPDLDVVAHPATPDQAISTVARLRPDVVLIDIDPDDVALLQTARHLQRQLPDVRTLLITGMRSPERLRLAAAAATSGGIVAKYAPGDDLLRAIRLVAAGGRFIDTSVALAALAPSDNPLTLREIEVLQLTAEGKPVAEVAQELFLSAGTVRNYLTGTTRKLGARGRMDAIRIAARAGWLTLPA